MIEAVGWGQGRCWVTGGTDVALVSGGLVLTDVVSWNEALSFGRHLRLLPTDLFLVLCVSFSVGVDCVPKVYNV